MAKVVIFLCTILLLHNVKGLIIIDDETVFHETYEDSAGNLRRLAPVAASPAVTRPTTPIPTTNYDHEAILDQDGAYWLFWSVNDSYITFETHVKTHGYVGFGLTTNGKMFPSDVIIGWVKDGVPHLKDSHTIEHIAPIEDESQDWHLIGGSENDFGTTLTFVRKLDTCDDHDFIITEDTIKIIYSYHPEDPTMPMTSLPWHGRTRRGTKSLLLLSSTMTPKKMPSDIKHFDMLKTNLNVPSAATTYHCSTFRTPNLPEKHHIISYEPIVQEVNKRHVHHIVIYMYNKPIDTKYDNLNFDCTWGKDSPMELLRGRVVFIAWAVGGGVYYFPENVGLPLGHNEGPSFLVLETHYDNPTLRSDIVDSSGIRLSYTSVLREHDASITYAGLSTSPVLMVPPHETAFVSKGFCMQECMENAGIPDEGVTVFAVFQHAHLLGSAIQTRHFRNGTEIEPFARDDHYDFDYQDVRAIKKEMKLMRDDSFSVECTYDSRYKTKPTYGGISTHEEMCIVTMFMYPRIKLEGCISYPVYEAVNDTDMFAAVNEMDGWDWSQPAVRQKFNNILADTNHNYHCNGVKMTPPSIKRTGKEFKPNQWYTPPPRDCPRH